MTSKKKKIILAIAIPAAVILVIGIFCLAGVYRYVSNVPKITPKKQVFEIRKESTVTPEDLADIECNGGYKSYFVIVDPGSGSFDLSDDKASLSVGDEEETVHVQVCAVGDHSEGRSSDVIEIKVVE